MQNYMQWLKPRKNQCTSNTTMVVESWRTTVQIHIMALFDAVAKMIDRRASHILPDAQDEIHSSINSSFHA